MTEPGQITIRELLRDPQYRAYFTAVPVMPDHYTPDSLPWRLFVNKRGETKWRSKRFGTYREAFAGMKKMLPNINDAAINCPGLNWQPPMKTVRLKGKFYETGKLKGQPILRSVVWKPRLEPDMAQHHWCAFCRRPTVFVNKGMAARMLNGLLLPATRVMFRCSICGAHEEIMDIRKPENNQAWDLTRTRVRNG